MVSPNTPSSAILETTSSGMYAFARCHSCACGATSTTYDTLAVSGATAIVTVTYTYTWITPLIGQLFGNTEVFTQTTQMRVE